MKNLVIAVGLLGASLSSVSFASVGFYCPAPSAIRAVPATHPYLPKQGFNYVATDEAGVQFESISPVITDTVAPAAIVSFNSAAWFNILNSGGYEGSPHCFYLDTTGGTRALVAQISQSVIYEGSQWSNLGMPFYECNSTNRQDCAFKFV